MKKFLFRSLIFLFVLGAAWGGYMVLKQLPDRQQHVATAKVLRGDVVIRAYARGELRAVRSATLTAPNLFGTVQVTKLAPLGALFPPSPKTTKFIMSASSWLSEMAE